MAGLGCVGGATNPRARTLTPCQTLRQAGGLSHAAWPRPAPPDRTGRVTAAWEPERLAAYDDVIALLREIDDLQTDDGDVVLGADEWPQRSSVAHRHLPCHPQSVGNDTIKLTETQIRILTRGPSAQIISSCRCRKVWPVRRLRRPSPEFCGCRPSCKSFLPVCACDRLRTSVRPLGVAIGCWPVW